MSREVMQQALDALNKATDWIDPDEVVQQHISESIKALRAELAAETQRRWDGNRIASDEAAEEAKARKELREQLMDAAGRTGDDVVMARLTRMAEELK